VGLRQAYLEMKAALKTLFERFPQWETVEVFEGLREACRMAYHALGFTFRDIPRGIWVGVATFEELP
jgi:hypothetical protein